MSTVTGEEYGAFDKAYDYFNDKLFGGKLPLVLITLNRKAPRNLGYYHPNRFNSRYADEKMDEIALNPDNFTGRTDRLILSTLVHEMAHVWQWHFGKPSRNGYHNEQWGAEMDRIGLAPSNTGAPGGKRTGQQMDHYIVEGGPFDVACGALLGDGFRLNWQSYHLTGAGPAKKRDASKVKFTCPVCGANAWGKHSLELLCGTCTVASMEMDGSEGQLVWMAPADLPEEEDGDGEEE